jgi:hypothetical protein
MTSWKRFLFRVAIFLAAFGTLGYLSLFLVVKSSRFQDWLSMEIAQRTGHEVQFRSLGLEPPLRFVVSAIKVSRASKTLFESDLLFVTVDPWGLISKTLYRLRMERPVFHLDLPELFASQGKTSFDIAIRHLNIQDGRIVLKTGAVNDLDFRSVTMNLENLNLGDTTGLRLTTELPWLQGFAEIAFTSRDTQKEATINVYQPPSGGLSRFLQSTSQPSKALEANIKLNKTESGSVEVVVLGKLNALTVGADKVSGHFEVRGDVEPNLKEADLSAKIAATEFPARIHLLPLPLFKGTATLLLEGHYSVADSRLGVKSFHFESPFANAHGDGQVDFTPQAVFSNTHVNLRKASLEAFKRLLPEPFGPLTSNGDVEADLVLQGPWHSIAIKGTARGTGIQLRGEQFSLSELNLKAPVEWADASFRADDVQISGKKLVINQRDRTQISGEEIKLDGTLEKRVNEPIRSSGRIRIRQGRFSAPDGSKVGENLALNTLLDTTFNEETGVSSAKGTLDIEQGELLWGKFFGDLKTQRPVFDFDIDYIRAKDTVLLRRLNLSVGNIGRVDVIGTIEQIFTSPVFRLDARSDQVEPGGFFEFFVRETLNRSYPVLNTLALAGRLGFSVRATGSIHDLSAEGNLQLSAGEIRSKSNSWEVGPIRLGLPFRIYYPTARSGSSSLRIQTGTLAIDSARFGKESVPPIETAVSLWNNTLQFRQPIRVSVYSGTIEINNLVWTSLMQDAQALSFSLDVKNIELSKLTEALGWYRFGGTLTGSIPRVELVNNTLRSQGQIQADVFGGRVQITKMEIENPFSSLPSVRLNAMFQEIQLERASETFEFGRISGILEGAIRDLLITAGQPSELQADIYTVERRGTSQWINVEALNKLTVLSSGNGGSNVYGGLVTFFDNFRYSKMGFKATLKNDRLTLRGVATKDGKEFLVVGSLLPPTVNIISHTQEIGFSELLRRLERIKQSEEPEIK